MNEIALLATLACSLGLIAIGIGGLVQVRNLFRMVLALSLAESGANLLLVLISYRYGGAAPIVQPGVSVTGMVDPIPQAMVLTSIVIGVGVQALALALAIRARNAYGTLDMRALRVHMAEDIDRAAGAAADTSRDAPAGERPLPPPTLPPREGRA